MPEVTYQEISAMFGNGSSMRTVLKYFIDKGATVMLIHEDPGKIKERIYVVQIDGLQIPLRAYNLNFYAALNSSLGTRVTSDKLITSEVLAKWDIPTPETVLYSDAGQAVAFADKFDGIAVKPRQGAHGEGISLNVRGGEALARAVQTAEAVNPDNPQVLLQQQVSGEDHRLLFVDYEFVAAVRRVPATITGDGVRTVRQIVTAQNERVSQSWRDVRSGVEGADNRRGSTSKIPIDEIIAARGEEFLEMIPGDGEKKQLLDKANVSLGGQTIDVTGQVNEELTSKIAGLLKTVSLPLCGVDVLSSDIGSPPGDKKSYVIELNAAPGLRLHEQPTEGEPRQVCAMVAESLIRHYRSL
jgi:cyanophycin synthetase